MNIDEVMKVGEKLGMTPGQTRALFKKLDRNGDGEIQMKEIPKSSLGAFLFFNFVISPALLLAVCFVLGAILAAVEGWETLDGFYFVAQVSERHRTAQPELPSM